MNTNPLELNRKADIRAIKLNGIPVLNIKNAAIDSEQFSEDLGNALLTHHYFALIGHDLESLQNEFYDELKSLFHMPVGELEKFNFIDDGVERGYNPPKNDNALDPVDHRKAAWYICNQGTNVYPASLPKLRENGEDLCRQYDEISQLLLTALLAYIENHAENGSSAAANLASMLKPQGHYRTYSFLYPVYYPALSRKELEQLKGITALKGEASNRVDIHADCSILSIVPPGTSPGLKLDNGHGEWLDPRKDSQLKNALMVMAGFKLDDMTEGLKDTHHNSMKMHQALHTVKTPLENLLSERLVSGYFVTPDIAQPYITIADGKVIDFYALGRPCPAEHDAPLTGFGNRYFCQRRLWRSDVGKKRPIVSYNEYEQALRNPRRVIAQLARERNLTNISITSVNR